MDEMKNSVRALIIPKFKNCLSSPFALKSAGHVPSRYGSAAHDVKQDLQYEVENSYITTKTLVPYCEVSISSRDLNQKKLVLSSSES